jgi:hypothetical protein
MQDQGLTLEVDSEQLIFSRKLGKQKSSLISLEKLTGFHGGRFFGRSGLT